MKNKGIISLFLCEKEQIMSKNITEQIEDLQQENKRLNELYKLFEKAVKNEFGYDRKSIHKTLKNSCQSDNELKRKLANYFNLNTPSGCGRIFVYYLL